MTTTALKTSENMANFQDIPIEIRLMIWDHVDDQRVVTIDHLTLPLKRNVDQRRKFIRESVPTTLHICQESRQMALKKYGTFFSMLQPVWSYTGVRKHRDLEAICQYVGMPNYKGSKDEMEKRLTEYVNKRQAEGSAILKKVVRSAHGWALVPLPQWLDPRADTLLLRPRYGLCFMDAIWQLRCSSHLSSLRSLGLVVHDYYGFSALAPDLAYVGGSHSQCEVQRQLPGGFWHLPQLQKLDLIVSQYCEVIRFQIDDKGLLKEGQWSYSLAPSSDDYKEEIGARWSGMLWNVTIGKTDGKSLTQVISKWKPRLDAWIAQKRDIQQKGQDNFGRGYPKKVFLGGGDGKTYLGPSKID